MIRVKYYKAKKNFVVKQITDKAILIPKNEQILKNNSMIIMNETAILLWNSISKDSKSIVQLTKVLTDEFEVNAADVLDDLDEFLTTLLNVDALEVENVETEMIVTG